MKILLVNSPCRTPALIPLGLGYIASVLRKKGHNVQVLDLNAEKKDLDRIEKDLSFLDYDLLGVGGLSTTYEFVKKFSKIAKKIKPEAKIIAGNMVSTAAPELLLKNSEVDICVIDEGEETIEELVAKIKDFPNIESVNGIVFNKEGRILKTPPRERIKNLDEIPYPAWDLFDAETYINNPIYNEYGRRSMNITTVRGCPFQCVYCSRPFGSRSYMRSPRNVIAEIKELKERYKIQFIAFSDDLFILNKKWVSELCDELIREKLGMGWGASARVNLVDEKLLKKMRKAGCEVLSYGFESGSQQILDNLNKGVKVEQAEKAIRMTRRAKIAIEGSFMIGMLGETEETIRQTIKFIKRTRLALHRFFYTTPYPGTPLYEIAKKMGKIPGDEDKYVSSLGEMYNTLLVNLTDMEDSVLKELKEKAEKEIQRNFSFTTRIETIKDEIRRVITEMRNRIRKEGVLSMAKWAAGRIRERISR